jgi:hypothetical protein
MVLFCIVGRVDSVLERWKDGKMERWKDGKMEKWNDGKK